MIIIMEHDINHRKMQLHFRVTNKTVKQEEQ